MMHLFLVWEDQGNLKYYKGQAERDVSGNFLEYVLVKACNLVFDRECLPDGQITSIFLFPIYFNLRKFGNSYRLHPLTPQHFQTY